MATPTLESFCCTPNDTFTRIDHFVPHAKVKTIAYNIVCIVSASLSILGVIYQLVPRKRIEQSRRTTRRSTDSFHKRIINWLAVADLLASLGILVRSSVWLAGEIPQYDPLTGSDADFPHIFCALISAWIQYFYLCTYFWTFCYALDVYLFTRELSGKRWLYIAYHLFSWGLTAILCSEGLAFLYYPNLLSCEKSSTHTIPHYLYTYIPMLFVMIFNPIIYYLSAQNVKQQLRRETAQFTDNERQMLNAVKQKFLLVMCVFYICWLPNIINGIMLANFRKVKKSAFVGLWTFMYLLQFLPISFIFGTVAVVNPLQAFLNSLVYRGVAGCNFRFPHVFSSHTSLPGVQHTRRQAPHEETPLLASVDENK